MEDGDDVSDDGNDDVEEEVMMMSVMKVMVLWEWRMVMM